MINTIALLIAAAVPAHAGASATGTWTDDKDGSAWETFADAVENYHGGGDLALCIDGAEAYQMYMGAKGYSNSLLYTDDSAWARDFEEGWYDDWYNDRGDYNYFSGHGYSGGFMFGYGPSGDLFLNASETDWGEGDAEVVALDSCNSLDSSGRTAFASANLNNGLHYVVGFQSTALDTSATAAYYGYYLYYDYDVRDAWHYATDVAHDATRQSAYVRFYNSLCETYYDDAVSVSCDPTWSSSYTTAVWTL